MGLLDSYLQKKFDDNPYAWHTWIAWRPTYCGSCSKRIPRFALLGIRLYRGSYGDRQYICWGCKNSAPYNT